MKRMFILFALLGALTVTQSVSAQTAKKAAAKVAAKAPNKATNKVADKVAPAVQPFPLTAVRLLAGPFHAAMLRDQEYLLALDSDRLLHMFRVTAGLPTNAKPLGGWEAPEVELRGHSIGHFLSALALMYASTGDERFKTKANGIVAELAKVQSALAAKGYTAGYLSAFPEEFFERVEKRQRVWAPYYTIHKMMAGLLDVYQYCGNPQALDVLQRQAAWVKSRVDRLSDEQQQASLQTEFGGMMEVLENLYAVTGNVEYQRLARKFDHKRVLDPLARGEDPLNGLHANTQIPKAIGAARDYELSGEQRYHDIASFFWERVAHQRSFVIGGNSDGESFFPPETTSKHLGAESTETCNTYNMLKLTRHLFAWEPSVEKMDFYERGLYNHILASQDPATGGFCYYVPLKPGAFKTFSTPDDSFWCCVGTGMENHAKYPDTIYFHNDRALYVNLFIASELNWKEQGLSLRQETNFPEDDTTCLTVKAARPVKLALKLRYPNWAQTGATLTLNGKPQPLTDKPGAYITLERLWKTGDTVQLTLPMSLHLEAMPDDPSMLAVLYGPIVLAGDLGRLGLDDARRYGPSAPLLGRVKPIEVPGFVGTVKEVLAKIQPIPGAPLIFKTVGLARPTDVTLVPFYRVFEPRYTVYWKVFPAAEWDKQHAALATVEARRQTIERQTVDAVDFNDAENERAHNPQGEGLFDSEFDGKRGRSARNGWLSYELKTAGDKPLTLVCTFRGSEGRLRAFDILVDGEKVATQTLDIHPGELFDYEYPLPAALTQGKPRITVKFQARPNAQLANIFDVRVAQFDK
ncbi:MAG: glycoside hydrolase family 127 protein [Acidobacteria bacterium]|nr:glycoside hydrolase family 127 protein [Acidobacteriota bacterium]MBI3427508.1 glycoside hydrolase family 127 protein [Acidobacteriota bacterium]